MLCSFTGSFSNHIFLSNKIKQVPFSVNHSQANHIRTFDFFARNFHRQHFQHNFSTISDIRKKVESNDPQAMFEYGQYLIDHDNNLQLGLSYLKKSADLGNVPASARYVTLLYEKVQKSDDAQSKIDLIPYIKKASSTGDLSFTRMHADMCLQLPSFYRYGLSSLSICANNDYKDSAEYFGMLTFLSNNFQLKGCVRYLKKGTLPRTKALIDLFENGSDKSISDLQSLADNENDIVAEVLAIFAELLTLGKTNRIDSVYQKLTKSGKDSLIEEPWKTVLLNAVGCICIGVGELEESYRFFQKAYDNGSSEQIYFLSFLRFYKFQNDQKERKETFNLIKKAYSIQLDAEEYDISQKYAYMLLAGDGCEKDAKKAAKVLLKKEERSTNDSLLLGVALIDSGEFEKGIEVLHQAALDQDVASEKFYGFYLMTHGGKKAEEAEKYLKMAAEAKDEEAANILKKLERGESLAQSDVSLPDLTIRKQGL